MYVALAANWNQISSISSKSTKITTIKIEIFKNNNIYKTTKLLKKN